MGGRGADYDAPGPDRNGDSNYGNGPAPDIKNLREQIGPKGKAIPMERAYKDANPNHDITGQYAAYNENCQRCIVAYELRRRGYDVTAMPTYKGDKLPQVAYRDRSGVDHDRWQGAFQGARPESISGKTADAVFKNLKDKMAGFGPGSRAVVSMVYNNRNYGHVFNVENRNGVIYAVDAQTGERLRTRNFLKLADPKHVTIVRTDNLRVSDRAKNFVTAESAYKRRK